jgi:hypothetical protein
VIYAKNNIIVANADFNGSRTYNLDAGVSAAKLSVQVLAANSKEEFIYGPAIIQVCEGPEHTYEDELSESQFLELGFNSRGFVTPITGFRIRIPTISEGVDKEKSARVHFVFYG